MREVALGGLFPLTKAGGTPDYSGRRRLVSSLLALSEINESPTLLPHTNLTLSVRDSRRDSSTSFRATLELSGECSGGPSASPVNAILGASSSDATIAALRVAGRASLPIISYSSTSTRLSDGLEFPYFARTVPADDFQASALVALIRSLGYGRVATVSSADLYGSAGIAAFLNAADAAGVTVVTSQSFEPGVDDFGHAYRELERSGARVLVIFCQAAQAGPFMRGALEERGLGGAGYLWIGSDAVAQEATWLSDARLAADLNLRLHVMRGFIGVVASSGHGSGAHASYTRRRQDWLAASPASPLGASVSGNNCSIAIGGDGEALWQVDHDDDASTPLVCATDGAEGDDPFSPFAYDAVRDNSGRVATAPARLASRLA